MPKITELDHDGITEVLLEGDISIPDIRGIVEQTLSKHRILGAEEDYLLRQVFRGRKKENKGKIIKDGTERDETSGRDLTFEKDFNRGPSDYTYCYPNDRYKRHLVDLICGKYVGLPSGRMAVFYKSDHMTHHPKYDYGFRCLFSFKDLANKRDAVYLVLDHEGKIIQS